MSYDSRIILGAQNFDLAGAMNAGLEMAARQRQMDQQNALANLYQTQGANIMAGDQNALARLAQFDPQAALGIKQTQQDMAFSAEDQQMQRDKARKEAEAALAAQAATLDAAQVAQEAAQLEAVLSGAAFFYQNGDQAGYERFLQSKGVDAAQYPFQEFPAHAVEFGGVLDAMKTFAPPEAKDPAAEQKIRRLMETGVDRQTAIGIVDGRLATSRDPVTGEVVVVDVARAPRVGETPTPSLAEAAPEAAPAVAPVQLDFGAAYPDATSAFGLEGGIRKLANNVTDIIGAPPIFPETMAAQNDFALLREKLINDIASGYGRQPPSWLLQNIQNLTPQAGSVFTGPEEAQSKLRTIGRDFQREIQAIDAQLAGQISPTRQQELEAQRAAIVAGLQRVSDALKSFAGPELRPEVADRLKAYE